MRRTCLPFAAALVACLAVAAVAAPPASDPAAVVRALYRAHFAHKQRWDLTIKQNRKMFEPELLALLDESERKQAANPDEVVGLDFDPITDSQEIASSYRIGATTRDGADAIVAVRVVIAKTDARTIRYRLSPAGGTWRVANILYESGDLVSFLREPVE
jgi:hypothetical protein